MIASSMPYLVLFAPGYVRVSLRNYDISDTDLGTHLTNQVTFIHDTPLCQVGGSVLKPLISAHVKAPVSIFGTNCTDGRNSVRRSL